MFSSIIREPLAGEDALLTIPDDVPHTHASPRAAARHLVQAAEMPHEALGSRINLNMPGVCCTVAEQIAALRRVAGDRVVARIRRARDPLVEQIVAGWSELEPTFRKEEFYKTYFGAGPRRAVEMIYRRLVAALGA